MNLKIIEKFIKAKLSTSEGWATHALVRVYWRQTDEERKLGKNIRHNGMGFTDFDSKILTSLARQWQSKKNLSEKQKKLLFERMPKYWKQIYEVSNKPRLIEKIASLMPIPPDNQLSLNLDIKKAPIQDKKDMARLQQLLFKHHEVIGDIYEYTNLYKKLSSKYQIKLMFLENKKK